MSTTSVEEVTAEAKKHGGHIWFQLYVFRNRSIAEYLIQRAEKAGVEAFVLTVDVPVNGNRLADKRNHFSLWEQPDKLDENLRHLMTHALKIQQTNTLITYSMVNLPEEYQHTDGKTDDGESPLNAFVRSQFDPSLTWEAIRWMKTKTSLPVIAKGVMRADDALLAIEHGVDAIIVSNHGGRQMDGVPATA
ncbi:hypothetical protein WR25_24885 [Diploscapter pachys]|uniref:FMN hydroxy acid dehydrogenase domain-containing protein n=1 Tax=Diploscapter pachys TaxID=2018661 RepID=A0A2A2LHM9_9BILA|nr:hypothetical protein WR25_24885 [Diploscapter pachys]